MTEVNTISAGKPNEQQEVAALVVEHWEEIVHVLPDDLAASARATGAMQRRREIKEPLVLLRSVLLYALGFRAPDRGVGAWCRRWWTSRGWTFTNACGSVRVGWACCWGKCCRLSAPPSPLDQECGCVWWMPRRWKSQEKGTDRRVHLSLDLWWCRGRCQHHGCSWWREFGPVPWTSGHDSHR